jgi:outer membrane protein with beta-barrel domain
MTFTTGYSTFKWKNLGSEESGNSWIMPFMLGYRQNFSGFYAEPELGYGLVGSKYNTSGISASASASAFAWGAGIGYARNGFDAGVRYQGLSKDGTVSVIGLHLGYNFTLGGK